MICASVTSSGRFETTILTPTNWGCCCCCCCCCCCLGCCCWRGAAALGFCACRPAPFLDAMIESSELSSADCARECGGRQRERGDTWAGTRGDGPWS